MRRWLLTAFAVALWILPSTVQADPFFTISVSDLTLDVGGTGFVDVFIQSTDGSIQPLALANYTFLISDPNNTGHTLEFSTTQDTSYLTFDGTVTPANPTGLAYVFPQSSNAAGSPPFGTIMDSGNGTNNLFQSGDSNVDPSNGLTNVSITSKVLLIRLEVTAAQGSQPMADEKFSVSLVPIAGSDSGTTFFQSTRDFDAGTTESFTSTPGTVTIRSVPEPSSLALLATGCLVSGWMIRRRALRNHSARG